MYGKRTRGLTIDGVTFFSSKREMNEWISRRSHSCSKVYSAILKMSKGKLMACFDKWKIVYSEISRLDAARKGHLSKV